jgi:hypothetical protein
MGWRLGLEVRVRCEGWKLGLEVRVANEKIQVLWTEKAILSYNISKLPDI